MPRRKHKYPAKRKVSKMVMCDAPGCGLMVKAMGLGTHKRHKHSNLNGSNAKQSIPIPVAIAKDSEPVITAPVPAPESSEKSSKLLYPKGQDRLRYEEWVTNHAAKHPTDSSRLIVWCLECGDEHSVARDTWVGWMRFYCGCCGQRHYNDR